MTDWTDEQLDVIGSAEEIRISSRRRDGTLRRFIRIWVVRHGGEIFVRSAYGPETGWFVRARASGEGQIRAGDLECDVRFELAESIDHAALDAIYHAKYDRHGPRVVGTVVGPGMDRVTLRLTPA